MNTLGIKSAWMFSAAFFAATLFGFVPNPLLGGDGVFIANTAHNGVHLITAAGFRAAARKGNLASINFLLGLGIVYLTIGIAGFFETGFSSEGMLLGFIHINDMGNYLHLGLGMGILLVGYAAKILEDVFCEDNADASLKAGCH